MIFNTAIIVGSRPRQALDRNSNPTLDRIPIYVGYEAWSYTLIIPSLSATISLGSAFS